MTALYQPLLQALRTNLDPAALAGFLAYASTECGDDFEDGDDFDPEPDCPVTGEPYLGPEWEEPFLPGELPETLPELPGENPTAQPENDSAPRSNRTPRRRESQHGAREQP